MARKSRSRSTRHGNGAETRSVEIGVAGDYSCPLADHAGESGGQPLTEEDFWNEAAGSADGQSHRAVIRAVQSNAALLELLLAQVNDLRSAVAERPIHIDPSGADRDVTPADAGEIDQLQDEIFDLRAQVDELQQQNSDLASQIASSNVRETLSTAESSCNDALSWEERKELILRQMENDSFDATTFIENLQDEYAQTPDGSLDPASYVEQLHAELARRDAELERREQEIGELQCLLEQQSETRDGGVAIGAAAIAQLVDADELVHEERDRLQRLQAEWEEKFRQGEIEASLERAKLSRERQQLAQKTAELEEQLEHQRREARHAVESGGGSSRRWLVKLGLTSDDTDK